MAYKLFYFLISISLIAGCQSDSKTFCNPSRAYNLGVDHGKNGEDFKTTYYQDRCSKEDQILFRQEYSRGLEEGLSLFCSETRGREQAKLGLEMESVLTKKNNYIRGYNDELKIVCSDIKAKEDAQLLINIDNRPCLSVQSYFNVYQKNLFTYCTLDKAYGLGLTNTNLGSSCKDFKNYDSFLKSYNFGLSKYYKNENKKLNNELASYRVELKNLKEKVDPSLNVRERIDSLESKILQTQQNIEKNKLKISK